MVGDVEGSWGNGEQSVANIRESERAGWEAQDWDGGQLGLTSHQDH